jgi:hypothetical protein
MDRGLPGLVSRLHPAQRAFLFDDKPSRIQSQRWQRWAATFTDTTAGTEPNPEAEVTELERLRCLVKTLEGEAQTLRGMVAEWNQRLAIARGQTAEWKQRYTAERSGNLDTRLKLVTALADLQALREKHGEPETGPGTERAESRLGGVPERVFHRGPYVSYSEEE